MRYIIPFILIFLLGCHSESKKTQDISQENVVVKYASKFSLQNGGVSVLEPWPGANKTLNYSLDNPPKKVICTSTTHLPFLELLGEENTLVGFPGTQYITSPKIIRMVENGLVVDVGGEGSLNIELILGLDPDLVFAFDMGNESTVLDKLEESGIQVVYDADFLETSALGRAEWIKFFGAFYQKNQKADSIFTEIESKYDSLYQLTRNVQNKPEILSGVIYGDKWFLPGGKNWSAQFFNDAGGRYFLDDNDDTGWLELSFEFVLDQAQQSDYWIGIATFESREALVDQDSRYSNFSAFKNKKVYNYSKRIGPGGGYDIFESGYARPDMVLADMIKILHPDLIPDYETYYFELIP
ncbi:MAG: ABC transporter substrate-binding protein [Bacteroidota bacterium]